MTQSYVIKSCIEVPKHDIFSAFALGFSDYIIPLTMDEESFFNRFFGCEGNALEYSFIAYHENQAIGVLLGGIRVFDRMKTMRCGTLCIAPLHRKSGLAQQLFEYYKRAAISENCKQLFLEVIKSNAPAIQFYLKQGYEITYDLKYYAMDTPKNLKDYTALHPTPYLIHEISLEQLKQLRQMNEIHINWQSDIPYFDGFFDTILQGIFDNDQLIGAIAVLKTGKVNFLWVDSKYRQNGIGTHLLVNAIHQGNLEKITTCLPSNGYYEGFLRKHCFQKDSIEQYEMYLPL